MMKVAVSKLAELLAYPRVPADYLALARPLALPHRARISAVREEVPGVKTLVLQPARGWKGHVAGQHVRVGIAVDGRVHTRTFTISSAPGSVEITIKAQGRATNALHEAAVGTVVSLSDAEGDFVLRGPTTVLTAGSGVTPALAMHRAGAKFVHVHWSRGPAICEDELRGYGARIIDTTVDRTRVADVVTDGEVMACGPESFLAQTPHARVERFRPVLEHRGAGGLVTLGEKTFHADGPILLAAEAAGLAPKHGCRMGICHTCDATLNSGCVRDLRTGQLIDEPGARIQICVCAAAGDVEVSQ